MTAAFAYQFGPPPSGVPWGHSRLDLDLGSPDGSAERLLRSCRVPVAGLRLGTCRYAHRMEGNGPDLETEVCMGLLTMECCRQNYVYGYTFGGHLVVDRRAGSSHLMLASEAPIFEVSTDPDALSAFLYSEWHSLVARRRAAWGRDDAGFAQALAQLRPIDLFVASLNSLATQLKTLAAQTRLPEYAAGQKAVMQAIAALQATGHWPADPPTLEDIL